MAKFQPPDNFDFSHPERWPEWHQRFHRYRIATKLDKEEAEVQVCTLLYSMGKEAEQVYQTFTFGKGDREDYDAVITKLDNYFVPKVNVIHEHARFHMRIQKPDVKLLSKQFIHKKRFSTVVIRLTQTSRISL